MRQGLDVFGVALTQPQIPRIQLLTVMCGCRGPWRGVRTTHLHPGLTRLPSPYKGIRCLLRFGQKQLGMPWRPELMASNGACHCCEHMSDTFCLL